MKVVEFRSRDTECQPELIAALEKLLADAKAGKLHRLALVAHDDLTQETYHARHRAVDTSMIGGVACLLHKLQTDWCSPC